MYFLTRYYFYFIENKVAPPISTFLFSFQSVQLFFFHHECIIVFMYVFKFCFSPKYILKCFFIINFYLILSIRRHAAYRVFLNSILFSNTLIIGFSEEIYLLKNILDILGIFYFILMRFTR